MPLAAIACCLALAAPVPVPAHYAPYAALVGEWDVVSRPGDAPFAVARFRWGPGRSYLWHSIAMMDAGREVPHLEGLLVWNGATRKLDLLFALDLQGGSVQEQGTMSAEPDGEIVRAHVAIDGAGRREAFRQTYRVEAPGRIATSILRQSASGWVATFPGSDRMLLIRRDAPGTTTPRPR